MNYFGFLTLTQKKKNLILTIIMTIIMIMLIRIK